MKAMLKNKIKTLELMLEICNIKLDTKENETEKFYEGLLKKSYIQHISDLEMVLKLFAISDIIKSCEKCKHFEKCGHKHLAELQNRRCFEI